MNFKHTFVQWGKWATPRLGTEYPCMTKSIPAPPSGGVPPKISDELAMQIHDCVITMRKVSPELYDIFMATYAYRMPWRNEYDRNRVIVRQGICETFDISRAEGGARLKAANLSMAMMLVKGQCIMLA